MVAGIGGSPSVGGTTGGTPGPEERPGRKPERERDPHAGKDPSSVLGMGNQLVQGEIQQTHKVQNDILNDTRAGAQATLDATTTRAIEVSPQAQNTVNGAASGARHA